MAQTRRHATHYASCVILICLVAVLGRFTAADATARPAQTMTPRPTISVDGQGLETSGTVIVSGTGFTPGGNVGVVVFVTDPWNRQFEQMLMVTTSRARSVVSHYAGDGLPAGDPTYNTPGGRFLVSFDKLCEAEVLVQAYDQETAVWSNWLEVTPSC